MRVLLAGLVALYGCAETRPLTRYDVFSPAAHGDHGEVRPRQDELLWRFDAGQVAGDSGELMRWHGFEEHEGHSYPGQPAPLYVPTPVPTYEIGPYRYNE